MIVFCIRFVFRMIFDGAENRAEVKKKHTEQNSCLMNH